MPPRWGRKRCSRLCSPSPYGPRPRACLDSLEIPFQTPLVLRQLPRSEIPPCYIKTSKNQCRVRSICHCVDQNYCTTETCRSPSRCAQSNNLYCSYGNKDIEEDRICNRTCRYRDSDDDSSAKDSEDERGSKTSNDEFGLTKDSESRADNQVNKPSNTNDTNSTEMSDEEAKQNEDEHFSNNRVRDRSKINSMMSTSDNKDVSNQIKNNSHEVHCMTSFNRHMQVMQTETNTKKTRDASSMASPESLYGEHDVQGTRSLTQANTSMRENFNRNNQIKNENESEDEDEYDEERLNKNTLNSCCPPGYECPQTELPLSQDDFIYPQSALADDFNDSDDNKRYNITSTPIRKNPYPSTKTDSLRIRDSRDILLQENQSPSIPAPRIMDHSNFNQNYSISQDKSDVTGVSNSTQNRIDQSEICGKGGSKCKRRNELRSSSLNHIPSRGSKSPHKDMPRRYSSGQLNQVRFSKSINRNPDPNSSIEKQKENSKRFQPSKSESNENYPTQYTGYIPRKSSPVVSLPCEGCSHGCCPRDKPRDKKDINCVCSNEIPSELPKKDRFECTKTPSCNFEDGTTSCASTACVVNTKVGCLCHYPPAFSYLSCSGNISGSCNCSDKK